MRDTTSRDQMVSELRRLLHDVFVATEQGALHSRIARAHGYADGYMKSLLDAGLTSQRELLAIVAEERAKVAGPATKLLRLDEIPRGAA